MATFDVIFLGGGPAGYVGAIRCAQLGLNTAVVEREGLGGAGAVGCEFADVFNAFGSDVSIIEVLPNILPLEDADCSKEVERSFKKRGMTVLTGAKISSVKVGKDGVSMSV